MIIGFLLLLVFFTIVNVANLLECDVIFAPIKGLMFGALYHDEDYDNETEHTIQVLLVFFSVNFIWSTFDK